MLLKQLMTGQRAKEDTEGYKCLTDDITEVKLKLIEPTAILTK